MKARKQLKADVQLNTTPAPAGFEDIDLSGCMSVDRAVEILYAHHGGVEGWERVLRREGFYYYGGTLYVVRPARLEEAS